MSDNRHICGSPYAGHCKHLHYSGRDEVIGTKKLDDYCLYCTAGERPKKIAGIASWTGLTPKWCPKLEDKKYDG